MSLSETYKLYNLTCEGHQFMSVKPPTAVPDSYYSLVEVCYTSSIIKSIKGIYVGETEAETCECIYNDLDLDTVLNGEGTYLNRIRNYIDRLEQTDKDNIIHGDSIIDFGDENISDVLEKVFLIGLGSVLVYYHFISVDQETIGHPFYPVRIEFPTEEIDVTVLDQNVYKYLSYPAKIIINIPVKGNGKLWMVQLINFWNGWGDLFPKQLSLDKSTNEVIYDSIVGYSNYLYNQTACMCKYFKTAENVVTEGCAQIEETTKDALKIIGDRDMDFEKKFKYASLLLTSITTMVLKTIKTETDLSLEELIECKEKCMVPVEEIYNQIDTIKKSTVEDLEKIKADTQLELRKISKSYKINIDSKIKEVNKTIDEVQKHLKIYTTKNIQELYRGKKEIIRYLYDKIPEIVSKVEYDVECMIDKNINKRIECKFSDVLCEYKRKAANRLSEVLNPVVARKTNEFKDKVDRSIRQAQSQADRARMQANRASDLVMGIGCLEKRLKDLETGISETKIQMELDSLKNDMDDLKDMVQEIARTLNLKC
jgi:hypothetical protein